MIEIASVIIMILGITIYLYEKTVQNNKIKFDLLKDRIK